MNTIYFGSGQKKKRLECSIFFGQRSREKKEKGKASQLDESAQSTCPEKLAFVLFIF